MLKVPQEVRDIAQKLEDAGFKAYLVGGCLRDLLLTVLPQDWDIATDAKPDEIQKLFSESVYENNFGTVGVKSESDNPTLKIIEVTTFRKEGRYTDKRHPDEIVFTKTIEEDLSRRDFTVNAIALEIQSTKIKNQNNISKIKTAIVDPYNGQDDLEDKIIRAVGNPEERFEEDALRLMRAVRFSAQLGFKIEKETAAAIQKKATLLEFIAKERVRDELTKLLITDRAAEGVKKLEELGLLKFIIPELRDGIGVGQNKHHIYTVFEHNLLSLEYAAKKKFSLTVRIAALLHDVGKPRTKQGDGLNSTFYGHQVVGARMAAKILDRLRFSKEVIEDVVLLIREHMFVYDPEAVTLKGVRRLLSRVGSDHIDDLFRVREADRIGSGVPKAQPYRLRYLKAMIEKVQDDPVSVKMLKVNGTDVMEILKIEPGPRIGALLSILLEEVLDEPKLNDQEALIKRLKELHKLSDSELVKLKEKARRSAEEAQERIDGEIKKKYFV